METSASIASLAKALSLAQGEMSAAKMDKKNPAFQGRKYADLDSVVSAIRQPLSTHGLAYVQTPSNNGTTVSVTTMLMHESGEWIKDTMSATAEQGRGGATAVQGMGGTITYLRRYALAAMVGVTADEDTDGNSQQAQQKTQQAQKAQPAKPAPQNDKRVGYPDEDTTNADDEPELSPELAAACVVTTDKGIAYASLPTKDLTVRYNSMMDAAKAEGLTIGKKELYALKINAADLIIKARNAGILPEPK